MVGDGNGVRVVVAGPENQDGCAIDQEPQDRDGDCLVEDDSYGIEEAVDTLPGHQHGESGKQDGTSESRKRIDLSRSEAEARISRVPSRVDVGERGDSQRYCMGGHVQAVRK